MAFVVASLAGLYAYSMSQKAAPVAAKDRYEEYRTRQLRPTWSDVNQPETWQVGKNGFPDPEVTQRTETTYYERVPDRKSFKVGGPSFSGYDVRTYLAKYPGSTPRLDPRRTKLLERTSYVPTKGIPHFRSSFLQDRAIDL